MMTLLPPVPSSRASLRRGSSTTESDASGSVLHSMSSSSSLSEDAELHATMVPKSVGIVGMACRLPGANNPSQLWDNIVQKKDLQRKVPIERFNVDSFYHPDGANKGTVSFVSVSHKFSH